MNTNLHIDDIGNLILRDGKMGLSVSSQYVTPPPYGGGRVGALCLYAYCAGNPVNYVDEDGEMPLLFSSDVAKETAKLTKIQNNGGNLGGSKTGSRATIRTKGEISGKAKANVQNCNNQNKQWILSEVRQVSFAAEPINKVATSAVNVGVQKGLEVVTDYINDEK